MKPYFETKLGTVYHGDCLEVMKGLDTKFDLVLTDPPYGTTACKWDNVIPFDDMWKCLKVIRKDKTAIVLFGSEPFSSYLRMSNIKNYKYDWKFKKSSAVGHLNAYKMPMKIIEDIIVFYSKQCLYKPIITKKIEYNIRPETKIRKNSSCYGKHDKEYKRKININETLPNQLITFNNPQDNYHPTQKPVKLMEYLIRTYSNKNDLVLDFTAGSGTTGVACERLDRRYVLIEKELKYCEIIKERLIEETEKGKLFSLGDFE